MHVGEESAFGLDLNRTLENLPAAMPRLICGQQGLGPVGYASKTTFAISGDSAPPREKKEII
jgi:hypothetical protein